MHAVGAAGCADTGRSLESSPRCCVRARPTAPPRALRAQTLASVIGNLDSLLRAGLVAVIASWLMQAYMGRLFKLFIGVANDLFDL